LKRNSNLKSPSVYIITNAHNTTLYIGVTSMLNQRIYQHKNKLVKGFSAKYNLDKLVYFELFENMESAILREKRLKKWRRDWKNKLINELNPDWLDLYLQL
jgi:putative endonuclease